MVAGRLSAQSGANPTRSECGAGFHPGHGSGPPAIIGRRPGGKVNPAGSLKAGILITEKMLHELHIQNFALIEKLAVEFHPGLNLLTGETGSGKSILVDALGLALGGRASPEVIRTGEDRAIVTAVFRIEGRQSRDWPEEFGLSGDDPEVFLRREVQTSGKSRLLLNDQPATLAAVKALARRLVEVHGQGEQAILFERDAQLELLDQFAAVESSLQTVGELHARRLEIERAMEGLSQNEQERLRTIDLLSFQARELEEARLEMGEDTRLEDEKRVLANLEKIRAAAASAYGQIYEDEGSASSRVAAAVRAMYDSRRYDSAFEPYLEPLISAQATIEDIALFLRNYLGKLEANPRRLDEVEDRLALIDRLKRKYGKTIEEILAYLGRAKQQLQEIEHTDERRAELDRELQSITAEYRAAAGQLSRKRKEAARRFEKLVGQELAQLSMEKTRFEVCFEAENAPSAPPDLRGGSTGIDQIEFRISPNPGEELRPLEKIASGGELSRLMLALETVAARPRGGPQQRGAPCARTFIFDEVDAGIGGRVAETVGQRLKRLANETQVLCVTHLAQIACFADHHFYVEKVERGGRTVTEVNYLHNDKDRAAELARMLSGSQITEAALKHAAAMLKGAGHSAR